MIDQSSSILIIFFNEKNLRLQPILDFVKYGTYVRAGAVLVTVYWSLSKQQDLDTVIIIKVSMLTVIKRYCSNFNVFLFNLIMDIHVMIN